MRKQRGKKGSLTLEAALTYPLFLMVIVTILYIMRIVYTYGLIQHAAAQTARELSMYTYIYQVSGLSEMNTTLQSSAAGRTQKFNSDVDNVVDLYNKFMDGNMQGVQSWSYTGETDPIEILKNVGAVLVGGATREANSQLFQLVVRPMMAGYIGADSQNNSADQRLQLLRVKGGLSGLNLDASSFCDDGVTIDLVVCYTIEPIFPINIMPSLNLMNRAYVRGMNGETVFQRHSGGGKAEKEDSVWDNRNTTERGKIIQSEDGTRNLPDNFPVYSAYDSESGKATAAVSIDLRMKSYQSKSGIKGRISSECENIVNYKTSICDGVTVKAEDIRENVLIVYIPSSTEDRSVDRSAYDEAVAEVQARYPKIKIITKEID